MVVKIYVNKGKNDVYWCKELPVFDTYKKRPQHTKGEKMTKDPNRKVLNSVLYGIPTQREIAKFVELLDDPFWLDLYLVEMELYSVDLGQA